MRLLLFLLHFVCLRDLWDKLIQFKDSVIKVNFRCNPSDTDVFKAFSGRLKKVTTSYDQTRRRHDVWKKTSDLRRLEDVWFTSSWRRPIYDVLKTSDLWRLQDVWFSTSWRCLIYVVLKTSNLRRLEKRLIYNVFRTSDLWRTSWRRLIYVAFFKASVKRHLCSNVAVTSIQRQKKWFFLILYCLKYSENFKFSSLG